MVEVVERGVWERQGLEAENSPVVLLVAVGVKGVREEEGGSEKERRMRREMEGQREVQELLVLEESRAGELERQRGHTEVMVSFTDQFTTVSKQPQEFIQIFFNKYITEHFKHHKHSNSSGTLDMT